MRSVKVHDKGVNVAYKSKCPLNANIFTTEHTWFAIPSTPCNMSCTNNYIRIHTKFTTQTLKIYRVSQHNSPHSPLTHCPQTEFIIFFKWISHYSTKSGWAIGSKCLWRVKAGVTQWKVANLTGLPYIISTCTVINNVYYHGKPCIISG